MVGSSHRLPPDGLVRCTGDEPQQHHKAHIADHNGQHRHEVGSDAQQKGAYRTDQGDRNAAAHAHQ